eukprot:gene7377-11699_t
MSFPPVPNDQEEKKFYKIIKTFAENENKSEQQFLSLNSFERKKVHELTEKFGFSSYSMGMGKDRVLVITKKKIEKEYPLTKNISPFFFHPKKGEWKKFTGTTKKFELKKLRILTWNILFDIYDKNIIHTEFRIPEIFKILKESKADIIALQEVTKTFLNELLKEEWIKKKYLISDIDGMTLEPYGVLLLSTIPLDSLTFYKFSEKSKPLISSFFKFNEKSFGVCVVHLPSDKTNEAEKKREILLKQATGILNHIENALIIGDFNYSDQDESLYSSIYKDIYSDLYRLKNPKEQGYTYDPSVNSIAKMTSSKLISKRLDRILMKNVEKFEVGEVNLIGTESFYIEQKNCLIHPSDHFGLFTTLTEK